VSAQRRIHVRRPTRHLVRLRGRARVDLADPHARHARPGRRRRLPAPKGRAVGTARGAEGDIAGAAEVRRGREEEEAGRDPASIKLMCAAPAYITDDLAHARDEVRWFPALVSNHVVDLVSRYAETELPRELTDFIAARARATRFSRRRAGSGRSS